MAKPEFQQPQAYEAQVHELYECVYRAQGGRPPEVDAGLRFVMNAITNPHPREARAAGVAVWLGRLR